MFRFWTILFVLLATPTMANANCHMGPFEWSSKYIGFFCGLVFQPVQGKCADLGLKILNSSCDATAFAKHPQFRSWVRAIIAGTSERGLIHEIWFRYGLLALPGGVDSHRGRTGEWTERELRLILQALENLEKSVGRQNSHLWNEGGLIARSGRRTLQGQFGAVHYAEPFIISVVINVADDGFSVEKIAQRIAHESAHVLDFMIGDGEQMASLLPSRNIFKLCSLPAGRTPLYKCRKRHPTWFNFHPTDYAAKHSAEFYGKMIEEWVREKQGLVAEGSYRNQNQTTKSLWQEMKKNFSLTD